MCATPMVSVIIPTYNRSDMVREAIESVMAQTYRDLEIIVVDDGSTDDTRVVVASIPEERLRYHYLVHAERSAARNFGIRNARGKYVAFLDSDDLFSPNKLEKQIKILEGQTGIGLVYSSAWIVTEGRYRVPVDRWWSNNEKAPDSSLQYDYIHEAKISGKMHENILMYNNECIILLPTVMVRKDLFDVAGYFDERMSRIEDVDLWRRIAKHTNFQALHEPLVAVRKHDGNTLESPQGFATTIDYYADKVLKEDGDNVRKDIIFKKMSDMYDIYYGYLSFLGGPLNRHRLYFRWRSLTSRVRCGLYSFAYGVCGLFARITRRVLKMRIRKIF